MLQFFRKYQRIFFFAVTAAVIISFCFFGTFSTMQSAPKVKDYAIGQASDGTPLYAGEIKKMALFLSSDRDQDPAHHDQSVNVLNDGVFRKDFLETGIALLLAKEYFQELSPQFSSQWERIKKFQPYQHPNVPFLSAERLWGRFAPSLNEKLAQLKKGEAFGTEEFALLTDLYLAQAAFPASALRRWVVFQQKQHPEIPFDERLYQDDLSLFGFHTHADWFSQDLLELASQFIHNAAIRAEKEGHKISSREAKENLVASFSSYMEGSFPKEKLTQETLSHIFQRQIYSLGMDEKSVIEIWRKILLCRSLFEAKTGGIHVDPLAIGEFSSFAGERAVVEKYSLPKHLELQSLRDLFLFQIYLKEAAGIPLNSLELPKKYLPIDQANPSVVYKGYLVDMAQISLEEVALRVKVKEMWQWQIAHWDLLSKEFPALASEGGKKDRFSFLQSLSEDVRMKINAFSVEKMMKAHPEWIKEELDKRGKQTKEISEFSLPKQEELFSLLDKASLLLQKESSEELRPLQEKLSLYTQDGKVFFSIQLKEKKPERILTFQEALSYGVLGSLLDEHLAKEYPKLRSKFGQKGMNEKGEWKPLEEVKEEFSLLVFADLLRSCGKDDPKLRFVPHLKKVKEALAAHPEGEEFLLQEKEEIQLANQWKLQKRKETFSRQEGRYDLFGLASAEEGYFSDPAVSDQTLSFVHLLQKEHNPVFVQKTARTDALLNETKKLWAEKLLSEWKEKKAVVFLVKEDHV